MVTIPSDFRTWLDERARLCGLSLLGVVRLGEEADFSHFQRWLGAGQHAGMDYLERNQELRRDPRGLLPGARTAIVVGLNYYLGDKLIGLPQGARVAQYARFRDYHKVLWERCDRLLREVLNHCGADGAHQGRSVVDSAPILERALAARTSAGFIGKNTCYIHPRKGSFFLLAEILVTLELPTDQKAAVAADRRSERGGCGTCQRCQVNCPTGALSRDYSLDAKKCLAYWTIEHRGTIPEEFWPHLARYYFGCDICQLACPYNRKAEQASSELLRLRASLDLFSVATMDQAAYERLFGGTPMTRAKREGLVRNALIAMLVTKHVRFDEALAHVRAQAQHATVVGTLAQIDAHRAHLNCASSVT